MGLGVFCGNIFLHRPLLDRVSRMSATFELDPPGRIQRVTHADKCRFLCKEARQGLLFYESFRWEKDEGWIDSLINRIIGVGFICVGGTKL